jgi:pectinesterase
MKWICCIWIFILISQRSNAQSRIGITGIRDTSYNVTAEYNKNLKNYPFIEIAPVIVTGNIHITENIPYSTTKERQLHLDVYFPKEASKTKRTAIIFLHGGGWRSGNKEMHAPLLQRLADKGFVCIAPEYRLSTEAQYLLLFMM